APKEEEDRRQRQSAASGRRSNPCSARRYRPRSARRQHHGVLQGLQRGDRADARQRDPRRDHDLRGPQLHIRHQDAAGRRAHQEGCGAAEGVRRPPPGQGRPDQPGPGARDRHDQAPRPERQRRGPGDEERRRYRPLDGHHRRRL
ncbi:MAG: LSU ribosomal protein L11p (L12e), partial [uncultured Nocardioidaceae bacterium]